ncbi:hypothetical protein CR513_61244, partial [Mucuna pruriens]
MEVEIIFSQRKLCYLDSENRVISRGFRYLGSHVKRIMMFLCCKTNLAMVQIKIHKEKKMKKVKLCTCLFVGVSLTIFTTMMTLKIK